MHGSEGSAADLPVWSDTPLTRLYLTYILPDVGMDENVFSISAINQANGYHSLFVNFQSSVASYIYRAHALFDIVLLLKDLNFSLLLEKILQSPITNPTTGLLASQCIINRPHPPFGGVRIIVPRTVDKVRAWCVHIMFAR